MLLRLLVSEDFQNIQLSGDDCLICFCFIPFQSTREHNSFDCMKVYSCYM